MFLACFQRRPSVFGQFRRELGIRRHVVLLCYALRNQPRNSEWTQRLHPHKNLSQAMKEIPEISTIALLIILPTYHMNNYTVPCQKPSVFHADVTHEEYIPFSTGHLAKRQFFCILQYAIVTGQTNAYAYMHACTVSSCKDIPVLVTKYG